ncbi:sulfatase [bacterium]|nr:sulfatase [bacterium]
MARLSLVAAGLVAFAAPAAAQPADRPNVLFIVADDLRCELGCYGSPARTPNLDALAARGVRFERAYCQQAVCNPSRSSFLTGRRPDTLRLWSNGIHFRERNPGVVTLPQWFLRHGYETRGVGKIFHNWHTKEKGDRRSWSADEFLHYANHGDDAPRVEGQLPPNGALDIGRLYGAVPVCERRDVPDEAYYDGRVAAEAVRVLREVKDRPFFLAVGFWKPHAPFNAPKRYWDLYAPQALPAYDPARPAGAPDVALHDSREVLGAPPKNVTPTAAQAAEMRHGYLANVSYMDAQVGKVLKALADLGLTGRTVVVFLSDHGYHVGEHTLWGKTSCFEFDARVPLIVSAPQMPTAGRTCRSLVELVDLFPTVAGAAGLNPPQGLDGTSLVPLLVDATRAGKAAAFTQHPRPAYFDRTPAGVPEAMGYSARTDRGRLTEWRDWTTGRVLAAEWYDHAADPHERANRIDAARESPEVAAARRALHAQFSPDVPPVAVSRRNP